MPKKKAPHQFQDGNIPKGGRKAGTPNKITSIIKEALVEAARLAGDDLHRERIRSLRKQIREARTSTTLFKTEEDRAEKIAHLAEDIDKSTGGMVGLLQEAARRDPLDFLKGGLVKLLPREITGEDGGPIELEDKRGRYETKEEVIERLIARGIVPPDFLPERPMKLIEHEPAGDDDDDSDTE